MHHLTSKFFRGSVAYPSPTWGSPSTTQSKRAISDLPSPHHLNLVSVNNMEERTFGGIEVFSNSYVSLMQKTHGKTFQIVYENITGSSSFCNLFCLIDLYLCVMVLIKFKIHRIPLNIVKMMTLVTIMKLMGKCYWIHK